MQNPFSTTPTEHYRAGVEALDRAYEALNRPRESGELDTDRELTALVRSSIARGHFAAAAALTAGLDAGDVKQRNDWVALARDSRSIEAAGEVSP
jgi:hypothetical protein